MQQERPALAQHELSARQRHHAGVARHVDETLHVAWTAQDVVPVIHQVRGVHQGVSVHAVRGRRLGRCWAVGHVDVLHLGFRRRRAHVEVDFGVNGCGLDVHGIFFCI